MSPVKHLMRPSNSPLPKLGNPEDLLLKSYFRCPRICTEHRLGHTQEPTVSTMYTSTAANARKPFPRASNLPQTPRVDDISLDVDDNSEYAIVVSLYEVYNNGIFDLLTPPPPNPRMLNKDRNRRPLLFKSTEFSQDRKVVAGLRKVVCGSFEEALLVLNAGLAERRVAGTKSNAVSSRSHGFFCVEVKRRKSNSNWTSEWTGNTLTIADLAGMSLLVLSSW